MPLAAASGVQRQVTGLDPDDRFFFDERQVLALVRAANPGASRVGAVFVPEGAGKYKNLLSAKMPVGLKGFPWRPFHQRYVLVLEVVQGHDFQSALAIQPLCAAGWYAHRLIVTLGELVQLDE